MNRVQPLVGTNPGPLKVSPLSLTFANPGAPSQAASISGGTPPFTASACGGIASSSISGSLSVTVKPAAVGSCTVTLTDGGVPQQRASLGVTIASSSKIDVTTHHNDGFRTGWNSNEQVLTPANVSGSTFGLRQTVPLDDQVDTEPLVVTNENITAGPSPGTHDVVFVATENNTIYAIDAMSGAVLLSPNFGPPVSTPLGCDNNGPNVGINGTPVIDTSTNTMYAIAYTSINGTPTYQLHALNLSNLADKPGSPALISASHSLTSGTFVFNATHQRERTALLEFNGKIYAGFGSFCDFANDLSRGWLLGWRASSLSPLPSNKLNDTQTPPKSSFYLSSIWMSGDGVAGGTLSNLFFTTGNSDPSGTTYDGVTNIQESVVKMSTDLTTVLDLFTPSNVGALDIGDADYGSGGVLLLPDQPGTIPHLAAAAGKDGRMFLLNRDNLGGYTPGGPNWVLGKVAIGGCWCGQTYFAGSDGIGRIVSSGGNHVNVWKVQTSPSIALVLESSSPSLNSGQDPGFFTSISSNGTQAGTAIVWAVSRPTNVYPADVSLYAFNASGAGQLFSALAGAWPSSMGNANIVPTVANGKVYVASYKQLAIFGLSGTQRNGLLRSAGNQLPPVGLPPPSRRPRALTSAPSPPSLPARVKPGARSIVNSSPLALHVLFGTVRNIFGTSLTLQTRTGQFVHIDATRALQNRRSSNLAVGRVVMVRGKRDATTGLIQAESIQRAKDSPALWQADR